MYCNVLFSVKFGTLFYNLLVILFAPRLFPINVLNYSFDIHRLVSFFLQSDRCFTVVLATSSKEVVLIAGDASSRDQWVQLLRQGSGNKFGDLRAEYPFQ